MGTVDVVSTSSFKKFVRLTLNQFFNMPQKTITGKGPINIWKLSLKKMNPGTRGVTLLTSYAPSLGVYGAAGGLFLLFFTSAWFGKAVMEQVPLYNTKYEPKNID